MEPRAALGEFDRGTADYTLWTTSQAPHAHRLLIASAILQIPESKLRVVAPDVGGGFGTKGSLYAEQALVLWLAARLGRPVKWTAERGEIFLTDNQARDHLTKAELALDRNGKFLAMRVATLANLGAYLGTFAPAIPTWCYGPLLAGNYATPAIYVEVKGVFTNTAPGGRRHVMSWSASSIARHARRRSILSSCAGATSSPTTPFLIRRRWRSP